MKLIFTFIILLYALTSSAQIERAKDDLPENKINPNGHRIIHTPVDRSKKDNNASIETERHKYLKRKRKSYRSRKEAVPYDK